MRNSHNAFLSSLAEHDREALRPHLTYFALPQHKVLHEINQPVTEAYFPFDAVVSLVVVLSGGEAIEAAMVGTDGVLGAGAALNGRLALNKAVVEIAGQGLQCEIRALKPIVEERASLRHALFRHQEVLFAQVQQTAACNVSHVIEARLARWLLRPKDLSGTDTLDLTQEYLSNMLCVQRSSVSIAAHALQRAGFITYKRGHIRLLNVDALQDTACECYATVKLNYDALLNTGNA